VYAQLCTFAVLLFSIKALGNTSRNYMRCAREHVNVALQAARRTPTKLFQAAVSFFFVREWEREPEKFHNLLYDPERLTRDTIGRFIRACFNPDVVGELTEEDLENFTDAVYYELGGEKNGGVNMAEFLECSMAGDVVDYYATKQAFNLKRKKNPLEKVFADNVKSYHAAKKGQCFGLLKPAGHDPARDKMRQLFNAQGKHGKQLHALGDEVWKDMMKGEKLLEGIAMGGLNTANNIKKGVFKRVKSGKVKPTDAANEAYEEYETDDFNGVLPRESTAWQE